MKVILQAFEGRLQSDVIDIEESPDKIYRLPLILSKQCRLFNAVMSLDEAKASRCPGGMFEGTRYPGWKVAHFEDTGKVLEDAKYHIKLYELVDIDESLDRNINKKDKP